MSVQRPHGIDVGRPVIIDLVGQVGDLVIRPGRSPLGYVCGRIAGGVVLGYAVRASVVCFSGATARVPVGSWV